VTLLGDAAHPVVPLGQGANTAFEDAYELAVSCRRSEYRGGTMLMKTVAFLVQQLFTIAVLLRVIKLINPIVKNIH